MKLFELIKREIPLLYFNKNPQIGWWQDASPLFLYHGTHESKVNDIVQNGLNASMEGHTKGWVFLTLDPNTAFGYAAMSGETGFRAAGAKARSIPTNERVVLVFKFKDANELHRMGMREITRSNDPKPRNKLLDEHLYDEWKRQGKSDQEYYSLTEVALPRMVSADHIIGMMRKN